MGIVTSQHFSSSNGAAEFLGPVQFKIDEGREFIPWQRAGFFTAIHEKGRSLLHLQSATELNALIDLAGKRVRVEAGGEFGLVDRLLFGDGQRLIAEVGGRSVFLVLENPVVKGPKGVGLLRAQALRAFGGGAGPGVDGA